MDLDKISDLINSLKVLFRAIQNAERLLISSGNSGSHAYKHLEAYKDICCQQLELAYNAAHSIRENKSEQAKRSINLINELAEFVKEDAQDMLEPNDKVSGQPIM